MKESRIEKLIRLLKEQPQQTPEVKKQIQLLQQQL